MIRSLRLLAAASALLLPLLPAAAPAQLIHFNPTWGGQWKNDADAGGHAVVNGSWGGTPAQKGVAAEAWIAVRTDGRAGDGTRENPFDGSTQPKFDAKMQGFGPGTVIHLLPGTFQTAGALDPTFTTGFRVKDGWKIRGAGMGATTVKLVSNYSPRATPFTHNVIATGYGNESNGVEISDLTVDCNAQALSLANANDSVNAVALAGSGNRIARVEAVHAYGILGGLEGFTLICGAPDHGPAHDAWGDVIEDCYVHDYYVPAGKTIYANGAVLFGGVGSDGTPTFGRHGVIRGCRVRQTGLNAFQVTGYGHAVFDNTATAASFFGVDTGPIGNLLVSGNRADVSLYGFYFHQTSGGDFSNIRMADNLIYLTVNGALGLFVDKYASDPFAKSHLVFVGNHVTASSGTGQSLAVINDDTVTESLIDGNVSDLPVTVTAASASFIVGRNLVGGALQTDSSYAERWREGGADLATLDHAGNLSAKGEVRAGGFPAERVVYSQTAPVTVNGTAFTSLLSSGKGTPVIPASRIAAGTVVRYTIYGDLTVAAAVNHNIVISLYNAATANVQLVNTVLSIAPFPGAHAFEASGTITFTAVGASGSCSPRGRVAYSTSSTAHNAVDADGGAKAIDTTQDLTLNAADIPDVASGNSLVIRGILIEIAN